jgi:hypothetical protein
MIPLSHDDIEAYRKLSLKKCSERIALKAVR